MSFGSLSGSPFIWNDFAALTAHYPLHKACQQGDHANIPSLLVNNEHLVKIEDCFMGWTPAHWAAYFGQIDCLKCVLSYLIPSVSTIDIQSSKGFLTPAHCAAQGGHAECLQFLLRAGANTNAKDAAGETPLHKACRVGNAECVQLLVQLVKDTRVLNNLGQTPGTVALLSGFPEIADYINKSDMMNEFGKRFGENSSNAYSNGCFQFQNTVNSFVSQHNGCRKRSLGSDNIGCKRMRTESDVLPDCYPSPIINGTFNFAITSVATPLSSSVVEHENLCKMDSGYSDAFLQCMISEFHGC